MHSDTPQAAGVKAALDELIESASKGELEILERIYHDDMKIFMFGSDGEVHQSNKPDFIKIMNQLVKDGGTPPTWAQYHLVEADAKNAHIVISRKTNLSKDEPKITLSIDLVYEDNRWQITREVIRT